MKKYCIILVLLLVSVAASAQSHFDGKLPSWWKSDSVSGEKDTTEVRANPVVNDNIVIESLIFHAVSPALKIVRQQYRLKKDGDYFGRNNLLHFGESVSLAVKTENGTILQHEVIYPWANDKDYQEVNKSGKYEPVYFESYQKSVNGGDYEKVDFELGSPYVTKVGADSLLYLHAEAYRDFGLNKDTSAGEKDGYMLWVYEKDGKYGYKVTSLKVNAAVDTTVLSIDPAESSTILGGVYVVPVHERPGTITFYLVGVASTFDKDVWSLQLLTEEDSNINIIN